MIELNANFWEKRYQDQATGWDVGEVSTPLKTYFDQLSDKNLQILIPGCGNAHEAAYLHQQGFTHVFLLDWAKPPLEHFKAQFPDFPENRLICADFFAQTGQYDLIVEQTFFCAINPTLRTQYAQHVHQLLKPGGKLAGLLFNIPLNKDHPPFGGSKAEYLTYFEPLFTSVYLETCYNSISPRAGNELFVLLEK